MSDVAQSADWYRQHFHFRVGCMKCDKVRFARMFIDQPLPHIARIHPEPKVFGDLRALEMAHGITPVQTYLSILEFLH